MGIKDRKGQELFVGAQVIWHDPEEEARDLSRVWTIYRISDEIILIADEFGEAEVYPIEVEVVS